MLASVHPIRRTPEDQQRYDYKRILDAAKLDHDPRRAYTLIYCRFAFETQGERYPRGIALPNPPKHHQADKTLYLERGRRYVRLPVLERDAIIVKLYRMLQRITPGFTSDLNSVPRWLVAVFPWPKSFLELRLPGLIHDWFYHVARKFGLHIVEGLRRDVDRLFREQNLEMGLFSPRWIKPAYWAVGNLRWAGVRARGASRFRTGEAPA